MSAKPAILFAGQGAQFVGMGKDLTEAYQECRSIFLKANNILGYDLAEICFNGPESKLVKSTYSQPAVFVTSIACYLALCKKYGPISFEGTAGLSLGEWSALYIAGSVTFSNAVRILQARGRFMQEACETSDGAMLSVIGLAHEQVQTIAGEAGVVIANLNSPQQIVLSGERRKIQQALDLAKAAGAKRLVVLNVAGAYHSPLMRSASDKLEQFLQQIPLECPKIPVISNVTGCPHTTPDDIKTNMVLQVISPVQWVSCIQWFQRKGVSNYIECGPGRVLSGLVKRIDRKASISSVQDCHSLEQAALPALQ